MTSIFQERFGPTADQVATLTGRRVCRRDVPSARGTVRQVVSATSVLVRWDGMTCLCLEELHALEVQP